MAQARSYYPNGSSNTDVSFDPRMDPTAALQALINRETSAPRTVAAAPADTRRKAGVFRSSGGSGGGGSRTAGDAAMAMARNEGRHSFVKNMWGPNQVGGYISSGYEPGAVYGGWDPTGGQPGATIDPRMAPHVPQFEGVPSASDMQQAGNTRALALGPSLAENQWRERQEAQARGKK